MVSRPPPAVFFAFFNSSWSKESFGKVSARLAPSWSFYKHWSPLKKTGLSNFIWPHGCKKNCIFNIFVKEYAKSSRKKGVVLRGVITFKSSVHVFFYKMVLTNGPKSSKNEGVLKLSQMCHAHKHTVSKTFSFSEKVKFGCSFEKPWLFPRVF